MIIAEKKMKMKIKKVIINQKKLIKWPSLSKP